MMHLLLLVGLELCIRGNYGTDAFVADRILSGDSRWSWTASCCRLWWFTTASATSGPSWSTTLGWMTGSFPKCGNMLSSKWCDVETITMWLCCSLFTYQSSVTKLVKGNANNHHIYSEGLLIFIINIADILCFTIVH